MRIFYKNIILLGCVALANSSFPVHLKKCNRKDNDFRQCCKNAATYDIAQLTKPYPEINLPNVDPLEVDVLDIPAGKKGVVAFEQKYRNCKFYGLSKSVIDDLNFNFLEKTVNIEVSIPDLKMQCQYEFSGKMLVFPVVGKGTSTIDSEKGKVHIMVKWEETKKNDKTFLKFVGTPSFTLNPDLIKFNFENLFNGDKTLGDNINKVLNENWIQVYEDIRSGYERACGTIAQEIFNDFFSKISMEEAFN